MNTTTVTLPTNPRGVEVTSEYHHRHYPNEYYRITLDMGVVADIDLEALMEHINEEHITGVSFDYWVDDDHKVFNVVRDFDPAEE